MSNTEQMIELRVERMIDRLDRDYMAGMYSDSQYNEEMKKIDEWAETQYSQIKE